MSIVDAPVALVSMWNCFVALNWLAPLIVKFTTALAVEAMNNESEAVDAVRLCLTVQFVMVRRFSVPVSLATPMVFEKP